MIKPSYLFIASLIAILTTYLIVLGQEKTVALIKAEYLFILGLIPLALILVFFKIKLKSYQIIDYTKNTIPLKQTIVIFFIFQVIDYIYEGGFIGMISQWFLYWIMGLIALLVIENINHYKNYKYIYN